MLILSGKQLSRKAHKQTSSIAKVRIKPVFSALGVGLVFVSVQHGLLAGLERGGIFQCCVTVLGMTPGLVAITESVVVSRAYACAICTCL